MSNTSTAPLILSGEKDDNSYFQLIVNEGGLSCAKSVAGKWSQVWSAITKSVFDIDFNCWGNINDDRFCKPGLFSGTNLTNAPTSGWFNFISFPSNSNISYAFQFGFYNSANIIHYVMRAKVNESWDGVEWKEFNVTYK